MHGSVSEKEGLSGCLPASRMGAAGAARFGGVLGGDEWEGAHACECSSANLAESAFKSSPALTGCRKKLLNFLCDLPVFLSG